MLLFGEGKLISQLPNCFIVMMLKADVTAVEMHVMIWLMKAGITATELKCR